MIDIPRAPLKRVITNLVRNSIESISQNGFINLSLSLPQNRRCQITIEDSGCGFSEEAMSKLFQKGFTTKTSGSGRGLSFCLKKVREWKGSVLVDSKPGSTKIHLELPLTSLECSFVAPDILDEADDLLVVDDHPVKNLRPAIAGRQTRFIERIADFEALMDQKSDLDSTLIVFDLHLENGRKALEVLNRLPKTQDFLFLTSDYLNPELVEMAHQRSFLVIPKELLGFDLKVTKDLSANMMGPELAGGRMENLGQI